MADTSDKDQSQGGLGSILSQLPFDRLRDEATKGFSALSQKAIDSAGNKVTDATERLNDMASGGGPAGQAAKKAAKGGAEAAASGESPVKGAMKGGAKGALGGVKDKVKDAIPGLGGGGGGGSKATKATVIIEEIDVGVPIDVAYNQWTQFQEFSDFMKKVESVDQEEDTKVNFKAQIFWSHRKWDATIQEQVPDEKIVWRSSGDKGHVDGSVTFHELAPRLTRVVLVLEYYPQGLMERTGNIWRAQGRRARLELKHFQRHVMMNTMLEEPEEVEGWRGEIHDSEVTRSHEEVVEEEQSEEEEPEDEGESADEQASDEEYAEDEADEGEDDEEGEDDADEGEDDGQPEDGQPEDAEEEYEEEEPADEYEEEPAEEYEDDEGEDDEDAEEPEEGAEEEYEAEEPADEYAEEDEEEPAEEEPEEEPAPRRRRRRR